MRKKGHTEKQIIAALKQCEGDQKQCEGDQKTTDICRKLSSHV